MNAASPARHAIAADPVGGVAAHGHVPGELTAALAIGAIGVVFGDIGTSPLYAFREALGQTGAGVTANDIIGVLSLALWALTIVVTLKYVLFLMRADNDGEGGVLALMALAQRAIGRRSLPILILGAAGASLFYGDGIVTPALSVLSAVEGIRTIPGIGAGITESMIVAATVVILVLLFMAQSRGTSRVAALFGPVCLVWFFVIGGLGLAHILDAPRILLALSPSYAVTFIFHHGITGLFVLGAVFLTVTGAEALTADMGHFGARPIRIGWFSLVFPALALNYMGQGSFALASLAQSTAAGRAFVNQDWFFVMAPDAARVPLVIIATLATIIASQAVITGAYSLTQQAIQLGLLPRLRILQTSASRAGQIYLPSINRLLLAGVLLLVFGFRNSSAMAAAYGIAVTGTMVVTTCLAFVIVWRLWKWRLPLAIAFIAPFLALDLIFFGANILRVVEGGWVPLVVASGVGSVIATWIVGRRLLGEHQRQGRVTLTDLAKMLAARPPRRVAGTAVFLVGDIDSAPIALLHNLKHNKILHERNIVVTSCTATVPMVAPEDRLTIAPVDENFAVATLRYGFTERPDVPNDLARITEHGFARLDPMATSYFIGRNGLQPSHRSIAAFIRDLLFIFLQRNASEPSDSFAIPPNRIVELGAQIAL